MHRAAMRLGNQSPAIATQCVYAAPSGRSGRIAATAAQKALMIDTFVEFHRLHFSRNIISKLTGYSSAFVGQMLCDAGKRERWDNPDDCRAALPQALRESCDHLMSARAAQPIDPRAALAIARRLEFKAIIEPSEASG